MSSTQVLNQQPIVEVPIKVETDETPVSVPVEEKPKTKTSVLSAKYDKFRVFGYWFLNAMKNKEVINDDMYTTLVSHLRVYDTVETQSEFYEDFLSSLKDNSKELKKEIRVHNKPKKEKKEKVVDPDAPKKKRGRKKKVVEDEISAEEKAVAEIVAAAQMQGPAAPCTNPALEVNQPLENQPLEKVEPKVEEKVEVKVEEKPKKKMTRKPKKTATPVVSDSDDETTASEKVEPKKKTTKKSPKKVEEAPVVVQPVQELTVESIKEEEDDDDEESIETTIVKQDGVEYLHCAKDNKVYDRKTFDEIGYFSTEVNQVFLF